MKQSSKKSVNTIKAELSELNLEQKLEYKKSISDDTRKAVQKLVQSIDKQYSDFQDELLRTDNMYSLERKAGFKKYVAGIDEVGRGPLAGPVVAACVVLPEQKILNLNDSKKISKNKRDELYDEIREKALAIGIGVVDNKRIDEINILEATKEAMKMAIDNTDIDINHIFIDALKLESVNISQTAVIKGDEKVASIAAASIIAKVTRDRLMEKYHKLYPDYDFIENKGYGTKKHYQGLDKSGECPIHRMSFLNKYFNNK